MSAVQSAAKDLSNSPLFKYLSRLDLAKIAGELEEISLEPNEILFRQGNPGDAFYVIRSGQAQVYMGPTPDLSAPILINTGAVIGEIAILTGDTRSASIIARSKLTLWRMTATRFLALLDKERSLAVAIEVGLCRRVARLHSDGEQWKYCFHALLNLTLHLLGSEAKHILICLAQRERWSADSIAVIRMEPAAADVLDRLIAGGGLLKLDGEDLVVMQALIDLLRDDINTDDYKRLATIGLHLKSSGNFAEAVTVLLLAKEIAAATEIINEYGNELRTMVSVEILSSWSVDIKQSKLSPDLESQAPILAPLDDAANTETIAIQLRSASWHHFMHNRTSIFLFFAVLLLASGWLMSVPEGLTRLGFAALMSIAASIPLMLIEALPAYMVNLLLAAALIIPGIASPEVALSGFSSKSWLMIVILLAVGGTIAKSGLMYRMALLILKIMPGNIIIQSLSLLMLSMALGAGVASSSARITLVAPAVRDLAEIMKLGRHGRGSLFLGLITYQAFGGMGALFATSSASSLLLYGMLPESYQSQISWMTWFLAALVPHLILFSIYLVTMLVTIRPPINNTVDRNRIGVQLTLLGSLTREEIYSILALLVLCAGFATRSYHGLADVWIALAVCLMLFTSGFLTDRSFQSGVNWGMVLLTGVTMSLSKVMASLGLDHWLTGAASELLINFINSPFAFVASIAVLAFGLGFVLPVLTVSSMLALMTMPLAISAGYSPLIPVLVLLIASGHTFLPFVNPTVYYAMTHACENYLFSHAQARYPLMIEAVIRIVAVTASVPLWIAMGLM